MFFCKNCGNDIKSLSKQIRSRWRKYAITGCPRWLYYIKCDCCNNFYNYRNFMEHNISLIHI